MEAEHLLENLPKNVAVTTQRLRELIRMLPELEERVYPVWKGLGYRHPKAGFVCGIFPSRKGVALGFEWGALLPDPRGLLEPGPSGGKRVRYLRYAHPGEIRPSIVRTFLKAAISIRRGADVKPRRSA